VPGSSRARRDEALPVGRCAWRLQHDHNFNLAISVRRYVPVPQIFHEFDFEVGSPPFPSLTSIGFSYLAGLMGLLRIRHVCGHVETI
jgi:hypothetical protein